MKPVWPVKSLIISVLHLSLSLSMWLPVRLRLSVTVIQCMSMAPATLSKVLVESMMMQ